MDNKLSELKAAAMAATPGPWILDDDSWSEGDNANVSTEERYDGRIVSIAQIEGGGSESGFDEPFSSEQQANARYITAANPAVVLELLAERDADKKRIAELESIRADASQVFKEIGNELGCNPDNESIMMAIDALKEREKRVKQLIAIASGEFDACSVLDASVSMARELLANREAVPVAWEMRYWNNGYNCWHDWERITAEQHAEMSAEHATSNDYEFRVLYDAPPVPQSTNAADWKINMQTGTPILTYKNCCVIESEQAYFVLSLINSSATPAPAVPEEATPDNVEMLAAAPEGGVVKCDA